MKVFLKIAIVWILILSVRIHTFSQQQKIADSVLVLLKGHSEVDSLYLDRMISVCFNEQNPIKAELYADSLIAKSSRSTATYSQFFLANGYMQKGTALRLQGKLTEAQSFFFKSLKLANARSDLRVSAINYITIADVYSESGNSENAILYYDKAIAALAQTPDTISLATAILNAGDEFLNQGNYSKALIYFKEAEPLFKATNYKAGLAYNLGNQGIAYAGLGDVLLAEERLNSGIEILEELGDYYSISVYLTYLSELYLEKADKANAIKYAKRSLELANSYSLKEQISEASLQLSDIYENIGDDTKALELYKNHIAYRDSFNNVETVQELANMRTDYEVSQKQLQVNLLEEQKKNQNLVIVGSLVGLATMMLFAFGLFRQIRYVKKTNQIIENEKEKSDNLLLNILPAETAEELKHNGKVLAKRHDAVSVLFTDFVGFTKFSESLSPTEVVEQLDHYFSHFDAIIAKYGLEKIKTIGDAYMCTSGLNNYDPQHALTLIKAAKEILQFVKKQKEEVSNEMTFEIRIGINSGPVVAGVVGTHKFAYDIWGDTVNIASRMESNSVPGKITISEYTYQLVKEEMDCNYSRTYQSKHGRRVGMYFVDVSSIKS